MSDPETPDHGHDNPPPGHPDAPTHRQTVRRHGPSAGSDGRLPIDYVLPLRWEDDRDLPELLHYLHDIGRCVHLYVVDGSPDLIYERHARALAGIARHVRPDRRCLNGKVAGVLTGVELGDAPFVVIADDDVRWSRHGLAAALGMLTGADLVRPQNVFHPRPWHARWDTGRILLNRAFGADYPGTYAIRRSVWERIGGYDGDVLFENLELSRTVRAHGGRERLASDLFVRRRPPTVAKFWSQRVRQAYDDFAQPGRLAVEAAVLPGLAAAGIAAARSRSRRSALTAIAAGTAATIAIAESGRRRHNGREVFPPTAALWAPAWLLERAVSVWLAIGHRLRGGVPYGGRRIPVAAHRLGTLRRAARRDRRSDRIPAGSAPVTSPVTPAGAPEGGLPPQPSGMSDAS
jgi:hypothetical protein